MEDESNTRVASRLLRKTNENLITVVWRTNIINLEDHLNHLGGEKNLLFLAVKRFNDVLLLHIWNGIKKIFWLPVH